MSFVYRIPRGRCAQSFPVCSARLRSSPRSPGHMRRTHSRPRDSDRHRAAPRDGPADDAGRDLRVQRRGTGREQDLHRQRPGRERAGVLAHGADAARRGTEHSRHHQHAPRLADGRPVGRHVRRRRLHGPHRRPELRLLRPRAHRGHPRPAGRAARQERRGRRAQRHHGEADVRDLRQRARLATATTTRCWCPVT